MESDFLYSKHFGLGFIKKTDSDILTVEFIKSTKKIYNDPKHFTVLPFNLVKFISNHHPSRFFDEYTRSKSRRYCNNDVISNVSITNNQITANVIGTKIYSTCIEFNYIDQTIECSCSCPVYGDCKHEAALYSYFYNFITSMLKQNNKCELHSADNFVRNFFSLPALKQMIEEFSNLPIEKIESCFNYICEMPIDIDLRKLINEIAYSCFEKKFAPELGDIYYKLARKCWQMFYKYNRENVAKELINIMINDFVENKFYSFVSTFLNNRDYFINNKVFDNIFDFAFAHCTKEEKDTLILQLNTRNYYEKKSFENLMKTNLDTLQYAKYAFLHSDKISSNVLDLIDEKMFFELINYVDYANSIFPYIEKNIEQLYSFDRFKTIQVLHKISSQCSYEIYINLLELMEKHFPNETFPSTVNRIRHQLYYVSNQNIDFKKNVLIDYYYVNYELIRDDDTIIIKYYAFLEDRRELLQVTETYGEDERETDIDYDYCLFLQQNANHVLAQIKEVNKARIKKELNRALQEVAKIREEKKQKILEEKLDLFASSSLSQGAGTLREDEKVSFRVSATTYGEDALQCSLKIGNKKFYHVKHIDDLFARFNSHTVFRYGKELVLYHDERNLTSEARNFLDFLMRECRVFQNHRDTIYLDNRSVDHFFFLLKNQIINFSGVEYLVKLSLVNFTVNIDENYRLSVSGLSDTDQILYGVSNAYIFNQQNKTIDIAQLESCDMEFFRLVASIRNYNIKQSKDKFAANVYSCYPNLITIDDKIKEDFKISLMEINTYFDYTNKIITVRSEYVKDGTPISTSHFDYNDRARLARYQSLLYAMGVKDNKIENEDDIYKFFKMDFEEFRKISHVYLSESILNKQTVSFTNQTLRVDYGNNTMSVFYEDSAYSDEELYQILKAIQHKKKFHILKNNVIVDINNEEAKQFSQVVRELKLNEKQLTKAEERPLYQLFKLLNYKENVTMDDFILKMIQDIANYKTAKYEIPTLNAKFRKYQEEGYLWLKTITSYNLGGILADDMGLGKTLEIIMLLKSDNREMPSLIVCPKSLIFNWKAEFMKFASDMEVVEIYGNSQYRHNLIKSISDAKKVIYLTSYDSLRNDENFYKNTFAFLVIDEGQAIKNSQSLKSQVVKRIKAKNKFALTGTPVENNIYDLWSLFDFLMPNYLDGFETFKKSYLKEEEYVSLVAKKVAPFILRRTKKEVLKDLPNKYEHILTSEMNENQKKLYDSHILKAKEILSSGGKAFDVLPLLMRLRQICVDPSTFIENYNGGSGKIDMLLSLAEEYINNQHRILIFSQFVSALNIVSSLLKQKKIKHFMLTGETKSEERLKLCNTFNRDDSVKIFLISLKAGGTGLNLIGADTIIHLDPWWNVAAENQASDRAHRIGQTRNVEVIKLICRDSIEQRVIELQNIKKDLIDKLISNDDSSITKLKKEDLEYILK